uniref:Uncharacterized protein n=1 Tax=Oryza sativa subsp. japonica TaxID=39947 RepID=Q5Z8I5_ORYSJ|nr:hypothetical protein [Oryza sativa Japonica Group]BAD53891.1 hypothetical protein [Oryza sativa Japonica Group]
MSYPRLSFTVVTIPTLGSAHSRLRKVNCSLSFHRGESKCRKIPNKEEQKPNERKTVTYSLPKCRQATCR